jgi:hypothetical protein
MLRLFKLTLYRVALLLLVTASPLCMAQAGKGAADHPDSRVEIYGGTGALFPFNSDINFKQYQKVTNLNATMSVTGYFTRYIGAQIEGGYFSGEHEHGIYNPTCSSESCDQLLYTAQAGPVFRLPLGPFVPFMHALGGGARMNGPVNQPLAWGYGVTLGGGLDYVLPVFHDHLAVRLFQTDFQYSHVNNGNLSANGLSGGLGELYAFKVTGGVVVRFGEEKAKPPVELGCSVMPTSVFPGDPVHISGSTVSTNPKLKQVYTWTASGGKITGEGLNPGLDTTGMAPGEYTVKGHLSEGPKPRQQADCDAPFTVRGYDPPTIACSATPAVAFSGTDISISTTGGSPQNRPLTYSYSATEGEITSHGPTAKLATAGLSPATITITCNVVDDLGQSATSTTQLTLNAIPTPVKPQTQQLCSLSFERDKAHPVRVDNEAKGCLDDIALTLNQKTDAKLIIVGDFEAPEKENAGAARALDTRQYLTKEKGIDSSRIELRVGDTPGKTVTTTLVPAGAVFDASGTHTFSESTVVRHGEPYGTPKPKKGSAAPPQ